MKKKKLYTGIVLDDIEFQAKAHVKVVEAENEEDNGEIVLVKNVIPGERISFRYKKKGQGTVCSIIENSPHETGESCPAFRKCGGCVYLPVDYDFQLKMKKKQMEGLLRQAVEESGIQCDKQDCIVEEIVSSPKIYGYRNKMEYSFGDSEKGGPVVIGMHRRNARYSIEPASECLLVHEDFNKIVRLVEKEANDSNLDFYHMSSHEGVLRHLILRRSEKTGDILVTVVTTTQDTERTKQFLDKLVSEFEVLMPNLEGMIRGVVHTENDSFADAVINEKSTVIYGDGSIVEELLGLSFKISPYSFFQTNSLGAEKLYEKAREFALQGIDEKKDKVIFDLYSGTGTIAQLLSPVAKKVVGVEIIEEAVESAKDNAILNGIDNCEFIAGDVLSVLDDIEELPDVIVLDPPRDGVNPKALKKILDYGVNDIIYISCKPTSLARDLHAFAESGYVLKRVCCVDMFPATGHVETVVLLSRIHAVCEA